MTGETIFRYRLERTIAVTLRAFRCNVRTGQCELRFRMVECGRGPTVHSMACEAILIEPGSAMIRHQHSIVLFDMTAVTILCGPFEATLRMTGGTFCRTMRTGERIGRPLMVE